MKKLIIGISVIFIIVVIALIIFLLKYKQTYSIEEISGVNLEDVSYIMDETEWKEDKEKEIIDREDFIDICKNATFEKTNEYHESMMSIEKFVVYDKNSNELFTLRIGNDWIIKPVKETELSKYRYTKIK